MKITVKDNYFDERTIVRVNFLTQDSDDTIVGDWYTDLFGYVTDLDERDFPDWGDFDWVIPEKYIKRNIEYYFPEIIAIWNAEMHDNITVDDIEEITVDTKVKLGL